MIILRSTDTAPEITPIDGMAWHYVWELLEFGTFKNGYACHAYSNGRHGGYERVMWCLRDVEDAFGYGRGELHGILALEPSPFHLFRIGTQVCTESSIEMSITSRVAQCSGFIPRQ